MGRTACTEPQCLYKGDLYLLPLPPALKAWSISWHTFWWSVRHRYVVNYCYGTWNSHFMARTFGTKGHAGRLVSKKRKEIACWMDDTLYANRILFNGKLIVMEPTSPERCDLLLTRLPSEPGNKILTSERQNAEVFWWWLASEEITRWGNEFEVENDKEVNSCRIPTFCVVWYLHVMRILCSFYIENLILRMIYFFVKWRKFFCVDEVTQVKFNMVVDSKTR